MIGIDKREKPLRTSIGLRGVVVVVVRPPPRCLLILFVPIVVVVVHRHPSSETVQLGDDDHPLCGGNLQPTPHLPRHRTAEGPEWLVRAPHH